MRSFLVALAAALAAATGVAAAAGSPLHVWAGSVEGSTGGWPPAYAASVDPDVAVFSPKGALVAIDDAPAVQIWKVAGWRRLHVLSGAFDSRPYAHFSPDGKKIVTYGPGPRDPIIWSTATGRILRVLRGHTAPPGVEGDVGWTTDAVFSPDGRRVVTVGWDFTARIWDAKSGESLLVLEQVTSAVFSPDGRRVLTTGNNAARLWDATRLWDANSGRVLRVFRRATQAFFSPDGRRLITSNDTGTTIWDANSGRTLRHLQGAAAAISPDGTLIALVHGNQTRLVEAASARTVRTLPGHPFGFSPDGQQITTGAGWDNQDYDAVDIWDARDGHLLHALRGHSQGEGVERAIFSPNGKLLLTEVNRTSEVLIWDVSSGQIVKGFD